MKKMRKEEIEILKNENFIRELVYSTIKDENRISEAWLTTSRRTFNEEPYTEEFLLICESIILKSEGL